MLKTSTSDSVRVTRFERALAPFVAIVALFLCVGCSTTRPVKLPQVVSENATSSEIVAALNANSVKIQSIYAPYASIGVRTQPGWANCRIFFDRPDKLRLIGSSALVGRVVDCGCDGEKFWFWNSFQNSEELYYCRLDQYQSSALADMLPVDPSWFPEAFGVVDLKEEDLIDETRKQTDGSIVLTSKKKRPDGVYRKIMYLEPKTLAIRRQDVQDPSGAVVLSVECREQQFVDEPGVVMPKKLEIKCPKTGEVLIVDVGTPTLNDSSKMEAGVFQLPNDLKATAIDLGAVKPGAQAAQSTPSVPPAANNPAPSAAPATNNDRQPLSNFSTTPDPNPIDASKLGANAQGSGIVDFPKAAPNAPEGAPPVAQFSRPAVVLPSETLSHDPPYVAANLDKMNAPPVDDSRLFSQNANQATLPSASSHVLVYDKAQAAASAQAAAPVAPIAPNPAPNAVASASPTAVANVPETAYATNSPVLTNNVAAPAQSAFAPVVSTPNVAQSAPRPVPVYPGLTPEEQVATAPQNAAPQSTAPAPAALGNFDPIGEELPPPTIQEDEELDFPTIPF